MDELLVVGRVARAHGIRGQVIVNPDTDFAQERFKAGQELLVGATAQPRRIREVRFHRGRPVIAFDGIDSVEEAQTLAGAELRLPAAALTLLPEGTFYRHDLVGCEVRDVQERVIGTVTAVEGTIERSYLVVAGPAGEVMVPMVGGICVRVDPAAQEI
ncbi:MAG: ribosome maturation factor RimM, partial [Acidobacteria bacterium]|nr:ribosome maturation factor RimM [Acidobacteriota bacterium]